MADIFSTRYASVFDSAQQNSVSSPLLRLLSEIRSKIFNYALSAQRIRMKSVSAPSSIPSPIALPQVCRQLYSETATLGYSNNTSVFYHGHGPVNHIQEWINRACAGAIRTIELRCFALKATGYTSLTDQSRSHRCIPDCRRRSWQLKFEEGTPH
ncbi:hypothetical protein K458DRAFT_405377 [Lentithecium fluviatile CBS 122367]|uniref:Uncharacterized protein n=1 Tax=Lentithecium fluviatile CBS 122367 TaxID=1168545 RepID=A0A6G1IWW2_9PLEO|nr:hypothetical protein K458DRAFT_405377 [Lentithecium fluviatile CBS 122367]